MVSRYFEDLANNPVPRGRNIDPSRSKRDPYSSDFSERYDLNSARSVEPTLLLHLVVVLAADVPAPQQYEFHGRA